MRLPVPFAAGLLLVHLTAALASAQPATGELERQFFRQQRLADERLADERADIAPVESLFDVQWGGWLEYYAFHYDDGVQSSRFAQRPGLALWTRVRADDGAHELFARMRLRYVWFQPGDEIDRQEDWEGPNFDQLWYQIDVGKAFRLTDPGDPVGLRVRVGRQTVRFGTGFAFDLPHDAVLLDGRLHDFRIQGLVGKSIPGYPNIDRSEPVDSHMDRRFYGVQVQYEGWQHHVPFVYALWNNDKTDERPEVWLQDYAYDSFYAGFGSQGEIIPDLNYWAEGVFESGHSYGDSAWMRQDYIQAFAWDLGIEKFFDVPTSPRLVAEYMFGSGDEDRLFSPTNADGGNRGDNKDTSFVGFGFRDTGIAAALTPANLHIWRLGGSFKPLEQFEPCRDLEFGTNWFLYHKNHAQAAISDPLADEFSADVGWEMDYFLNWRFASDLSWTVRWGVFYPGGAYSENRPRHFIFSGLTWSF